VYAQKRRVREKEAGSMRVHVQEVCCQQWEAQPCLKRAQQANSGHGSMLATYQTRSYGRARAVAAVARGEVSGMGVVCGVWWVCAVP